MKLIEALRICGQPVPPGAPQFSVALACGFTPLHLENFLRAHLRQRAPNLDSKLTTGLYGDLPGTLEGLDTTNHDSAAVFLEWPDIDLRLGVRHLGSWAPGLFPDILAGAERSLGRIEMAIRVAASRIPVIVCLPSLRLPPVSYSTTYSASHLNLQLEQAVLRFADSLVTAGNVHILDPRRLEADSPLASRHDIRSELASGFPYTAAHTDALGENAARLLLPPPPKKGLITDLDDTLWRGILGDDGVDGVSWDQEHGSAIYGVYQQLLGSLAQSGILVGVASKNNSELVTEVFNRGETIVKHDDLYPMEINWDMKSISIARIIETWNIGPDSVVFIDDSPMEIAEVKKAHPAVECILFPKNDPEAVYALCHQLRDWFGRDRVTDEDKLRSGSIRSAAALRDSAKSSGASLDNFLRDVDARISFAYAKTPPDPRVFELINKTNQFNLNGRRVAEAEWQSFLDREDTFVLLAQYRDKYGSLGKIAALAGRREPDRVVIDTWVMSCRAFSRRIEHRCLEQLFSRWGASNIEFRFTPTERNGPIRAFLEEISGSPVDGTVTLPIAGFHARCPALYHEIEVLD